MQLLKARTQFLHTHIKRETLLLSTCITHLSIWACSTNMHALSCSRALKIHKNTYTFTYGFVHLRIYTFSQICKWIWPQSLSLWLIHSSICDQSTPQTWTLYRIRHYLLLANLHVKPKWLCTCPAFFFSFFFPLPSLDGKSEGRRVNIDAHSVPSQPQSIWIHSSLWRANNLEETLPHSLPSPPACLPLFVFLSVVLPVPRTSLSFYHALHSPSSSFPCNPPRDALLAFHVCSQSQQMNYRWTSMKQNTRDLSVQLHTPPPQNYGPEQGKVMIRSFNKCFYRKWTVIHCVFLAWTSRGFCRLFGSTKRCRVYSAASCDVASISYCFCSAQSILVMCRLSLTSSESACKPSTCYPPEPIIFSDLETCIQSHITIISQWNIRYGSVIIWLLITLK